LVGRRLREAWPGRSFRTATVPTRVRAWARSEGRARDRPAAASQNLRVRDAEWLHAGRFGAEAPLLAVHLGAGTAAKRWPGAHWRSLLAWFLDDGWRVVVVGGPEDADAAEAIEPHENLRDWTGRLSVPQTAAFLERAD